MGKCLLFAVTHGKLVHMGYRSFNGKRSQTRKKSAELDQEVSTENLCSYLEFVFQEPV